MLRFNKRLISIIIAVILIYGSGLGSVGYYFIRNKVLAHHGICSPDDYVDIAMFRWWPHAAFGIGAYLANPSGTVHIPPNYTETMTANLVQTKNSAGFYFEGAATITMGSFQVTKASGIHQTFIRSLVPFGFFGPAVGVKWIYTGNSSAFVSGDSAADSTGLEWENFAVDISGAGASASCFDIVRTSRMSLKNLECNGAGGANNQVGMILDGNGNFTGDSHIVNFIGGSLFTCIKLANSANANVIIGGACPGVVAGGKGIDIQSGNGNTIIGFDIESAPTGINVAASVNNFGNRASFYGQGNTADAVVGVGAIANTFDNIGVNCTGILPTITDAGTNTTFWNPCKFKMDKDGNFTTVKVTTGASGLSINGGTALTGQTGTGTSAVTNTSPTIGGTTSLTRIAAAGTAATSCAVTGAGASGSCSLVTTSTDSFGVMRIAAAGAGPAATGTLTLTFSSSIGIFGVCQYALGNASTAWNARGTIFSSSYSATTPAAVWDNNAAALVAGNNYDVTYRCVGE